VFNFSRQEIEYYTGAREENMKEIFILLADGDGTMRSCDEPFGVAVTTEDEAKRYVSEKGVGFTHSYCKVTVFDNKDEALDFAFPSRKERRENTKEGAKN
jgi:hypothetical protein